MAVVLSQAFDQILFGVGTGFYFLFFLSLDTASQRSFYEGLDVVSHFNFYVCKYYFMASSYFCYRYYEIINK